MNSFLYKFQAWNNRGVLITNQNINFKIIIRTESASGSAVYTETHNNISCDANGLAEIQIGEGQADNGNLNDIRCGYSVYFIEVQNDSSGAFTTAFSIQLPNVFSGDGDTGNGGQGVCNSFVISPDGRTGIGTLTPQYSLDVAGAIGTNSEVHIKDVVIKVSNLYSDSLYQGNLFIGWENGDVLGTITKYENIFIGKFAGKNALNANQNIVIGTNAGQNLDRLSNNNILIGSNAGTTVNSSINTNNICIGEQAAQHMKGDMESNIILGERAGFEAEGTQSCVIIGKQAGNVNKGDFNIFIGHNSGTNNRTGEANTFVGSMDTGAYNTTGRWNTFIGGSSGEDNVSGSFNTYVGHSSGSHCKGSGNTCIGYGAGILSVSGNNNVFIGQSAGKNENGNDRLYISNSETDDPLIYGEFDTGKAVINGDLGIKTRTPERALHVNDTIRLEPRSTAPDSPAEGDIYMDSGEHKLKVYDGTQWRACW
ncbi:MAG: hypothetical protein K8R53_02965 [Bacteroidales bacterium]|nr:hypothetical protein [Bacteroidales bacterium]